MSQRLRRIMPDQMSPEQAELYAGFTSGPPLAVPHPPEGGLSGPPGVWLLSPPLARLFRQASKTMRFELELSDRSREIALLLHAHARDSEFEILAHRRAGLRAGLAEGEVDGLASRTPPEFQTDEERAVFAASLALIDRRALDDAEYDAAVTVLGERTLLDLVTLIGIYDVIATQLSVFQVDVPRS